MSLRAVRVFIEVPKGSYLKREWRDGGLVIEYLSPFPSPYNYGCVRDQLSTDGDPADALVLGPPRALGSEVLVRVRGIVRFTDAGCDDPKLICSGSPVNLREQAHIEAFFARYAPARRLLNLLQGKPGETRFVGVEWRALF